MVVPLIRNPLICLGQGLGWGQIPAHTPLSVMPRDKTRLSRLFTGAFLVERSWRGLEENLGQTEVTSAIEGAKGVAASYDKEPA